MKYLLHFLLSLPLFSEAQKYVGVTASVGEIGFETGFTGRPANGVVEHLTFSMVRPLVNTGVQLSENGDCWIPYKAPVLWNVGLNMLILGNGVDEETEKYAFAIVGCAAGWFPSNGYFQAGIGLQLRHLLTKATYRFGVDEYRELSGFHVTVGYTFRK